MKLIILAGGGGTRLFPLSRTCYPKQFMKLDGENSLLAETIRRFLPVMRPQDMVIVTNQEYLHHVEGELAACGALGAHILTEPVGRNTAPAIALAMTYCKEKMAAAEDSVLFVTPSDHIIRPVDQFVQLVRKAAMLAQKGYIVTFGVKPEKPETGYGYIEMGEALAEGFHVKAFREKPDEETARQYVAAGNYYWNSGMFAMTVRDLETAYREYQPEIYQGMEKGVEAMGETFADLPNISFDYAIAEKSSQVATIPFSAYWNDIGSWDAIYEVLEKDGDGNAVKGDCMTIDCTNTLMLGRSRLIAGIGLEDLLVVETDDVIVVAKKGESQKVKDLVGEIKQRGRREADEHTTMYRPWGSYTVLGEGPGYKMKKIIVNPGQQLSLQLHYHRSEHWIVTRGTAKATVGDDVKFVHENESIFVPQTVKHRLENPGRLPLEIIEVQNGSYLGEDDIVRFDDRYGRQ